jgi:hypothetical protein
MYTILCHFATVGLDEFPVSKIAQTDPLSAYIVKKWTATCAIPSKRSPISFI